MKKITLLLAIALSSYCPYAQAQWTTIGNNIYNSNTGNVGIGTTSPLYLLDIKGAANTNIIGMEDGARGMILQTSTTGSGNAGIIGYYNGVYNALDIRATSGAGTGIYLPSTGNVGIGTTVPKETLSVNGNIRSKQIKVEIVNWPDYVFKPAYTLPLLKDVKTYIEQNQHLPDMPSEEQVIKEGLNLGEIAKLQTKKIEELTLYLIEKDKQIEDQQKNNQSQQDQINQLRQQLDALVKQLNK